MLISDEPDSFVVVATKHKHNVEENNEVALIFGYEGKSALDWSDSRSDSLALGVRLTF